MGGNIIYRFKTFLSKPAETFLVKASATCFATGLIISGTFEPMRLLPNGILNPIIAFPSGILYPIIYKLYLYFILP